ncbi:MAG TPA: hypothetical protein VII55_00635 [Candidatus Saccharimonadales bacterium]
MINFPDSFDSTTRQLPLDNLGQSGAVAAQKLADSGYEVRMGLTPELADRITVMSQEPAIREFCPRDSGERFTDRAAAEKWLAKKRAVFLLFKKEADGSLILAGYGWSGAASSSHVPSGAATFAVRIGEAGQGHGLAAPFSWLIVAASAVIYEAADFWLETWASNGAAVHVYHKIGFETAAEQADERPTTLGSEKIPDTRVYMSLTNDLLPARPGTPPAV